MLYRAEQNKPEQEQEKLHRLGKEMEKSLIAERIQKAGYDDPKEMLSILSELLTPSEHFLIGSTTYGIAFSPNLSFASFADIDLAAVNEARKRISEKTPEIQTAVGITVGGQDLYPVVELLPLKEELVNSEEPVLTFKLLSATDILGNKVELSEAEIEAVTKELLQKIVDRQKEERALYFKKLQTDKKD